MQKQKQQLDAKIKRERIIIGDLPHLFVQILGIVRARGRVSAADAVKATDASRNTSKDHFKRLSANGLLEQHGNGRGGWYSQRYLI